MTLMARMKCKKCGGEQNAFAYKCGVSWLAKEIAIWSQTKIGDINHTDLCKWLENKRFRIKQGEKKC